MLSLIVAYDENRGIGKGNKLPWHYPADLKYFKAKTDGHTIAMGRKTFLSIGRALPGRKNIVFTRQPVELADVAGIEIKRDPVAFFAQVQDTADEVFVIGGREIFTLALPYVSRLYVTEIARSFEADTYFPDVDLTEFNKKSSNTIDELTFIVYEKEQI
jgi:dihydrofolate reductase